MKPAPGGPEQVEQAYLVLTADRFGQKEQPESSLLPHLISRWVLIASVALVCALVAGVYCYVTPTWYRTQVLMAAVQPESGSSLMRSLSGGIGGLAALAGVDLPDTDAYKRESLARITSREFTYRFLTDEGLIPILFADRWDAQHQRWKSAAPTLEQAYRFFDGKVRTVSEDRRTGLIKVTMDWKDQQLAMQWANRMVATFNADARATARDEAQRSQEYLYRELQRTELVELRQTINGLIETEIKKSMLASVREQYAFKIIDPAVLPGKQGRVWPRPTLLITCAFLGGILIGVAIVAALRGRLQPNG